MSIVSKCVVNSEIIKLTIQALKLFIYSSQLRVISNIRPHFLDSLSLEETRQLNSYLYNWMSYFCNPAFNIPGNIRVYRNFS